MIIYSIVCTLIMIIDLIIIGVLVYQIDMSKKFVRSLSDQTRLLNQTLNLMADDLTTDYHSKEWVIQHYMSEVRNK